MCPYLERAQAAGGSRVAAIGVAQEFQRVTSASRCPGGGDLPRFSFGAAERRVTCYYFYVLDEDFCAGFIKICACFPYPSKIWINGHEWAKRAAARAGIGFTALANGFGTCDDPAGLQAVCDQLGPDQITVFTERWWARLPLPLTPADRAAGYWWELSMRQVEASRTIVFDAPATAGRSSTPCCATTSTSAGPTRSSSSSAARSAPTPRERSPPQSSPAASTSPSTPNTSTPGSSSTSRKAAPCASRPWSTTRTTSATPAGCTTSTTCRPKPVASTPGCSSMSGSARAASSRVQP